MQALIRDNNGYTPSFELHNFLHHTSLETHPFVPIKPKQNVASVHWE